MKCWKCGKEMDRTDGGPTLYGATVDVETKNSNRTPEDIEYYNIQLGKYSDGSGEVHVAMCYECYIDNIFSGRNFAFKETGK